MLRKFSFAESEGFKNNRNGIVNSWLCEWYKIKNTKIGMKLSRYSTGNAESEILSAKSKDLKTKYLENKIKKSQKKTQELFCIRNLTRTQIVNNL